MESINDIAIKLSVDAEGVSRGFRTAAEETRAYQKELERLVYAVGKNDPVDYNAHVTQYTQATEARLAKEKKAQEEFNAWYRAEADKEFQAWYAVELKKENVRQQQLAQERQSAINTVNAQNFQAVPEAETLGRAITNDKLEEAIKARYALLDQEERALRENAANNAATIQRANAEVQRLHQQDLDNLREYITQKYAILNREEAIERMNASNAAEIARMRTLQSQQAAARANAQRDSDFAAYKADLARQEAAGMVNAQRTARIERARQLDAKRAADDDRVRQLNDWRMQQAMMQRAAIDTQLTVARMGGGFGGAAMAMGQMSYAAEDFIQVLSMGGGLNMALMSASNNLSMVARALLGTSGVMSAVAGFAIPALLIGIGSLISYLMGTEDAAEKAKKALEDFRKEIENIGKMTDIRQKFEAESRDIQDMKTREEIQTKINALKQEQKDLDEKMTQEEMKRAGANSAYFDELLGGQKAQQDFLNGLRKSMFHGTEEQKESARELAKLYAQAREAAIAGNEQNMLNALREMHDLMTSMNQIGIQGIDVGFMDNFKALFNDPKLLDQLQNIFNPNMTNLQENMELQQEIAEALLSQDEHMTEERNRQLEIAKKLLEAQHQMFQVEGQITRERQQRMRDDLDAIRMTDEERELKRLRDEQAAFAGIDTTFVGPQLPVSEEAMLQEFMYLQLKKVQDEIAEMRKTSPVFESGMEQNAFDAQAQAFDQMLKAKFERDPQAEKLDTLIGIERAMLQAIEDNAMVRVVQ